MSAITIPREIVPMPASCPWGGFAPPDLQHCEANMCGWIVAPSDTWSNLAYVAVAAYLWKTADDALGRTFAVTILLVGLTSFALHATFTAWGQFLDYFGMFLYVMLILSLNLKRLGVRRWKAVYWGGIAGLSVAVPVFWKVGVGVQYIIALCAAAILGTEAVIARRPDRPRYGLLMLSVLGVAVGFTFWQLDFHRVACDPDNHVLQFHAVWHVISALAMLPLVAFYRREAAA